MKRRDLKLREIKAESVIKDEIDLIEEDEAGFLVSLYAGFLVSLYSMLDSNGDVKE